MFELATKDFASVNRLLEQLQVGVDIVGAVLSGHTKGKVFVSTVADSRMAFVYDNGFCVLAGTVTDAEFAKACLNWLYSQEELEFFILYPGHESWVTVLDAVSAVPLRKVQRVAFHLDADAFVAQRSRKLLPPEFVLVPMDATVMRTVAGTLYPWAGGMWKSETRFESDGVGFCVLTDGRIVSLCYSVFVNGSHHEIDILTVERFKRLGLAKVVASAFIDKCLDRGLQPEWDCFKNNVASYQLAEVLGFRPTIEFSVYSWQRTNGDINEAKKSLQPAALNVG